VSPRMCAAALRARASVGHGPGIDTRVDSGWEFLRGDLTLEQVWRTDAHQVWEHVSLPHCFNAMNACDPEQGYFRGQGWYRAHSAIRNPYPRGRTLLHFRGAGQTSTVWVGSTLVGKHKGGYDEFAFDITDAASQFQVAQRVPITVMCDNTPDRDRSPSDLSDFCLYGGLYRHVDLLYLPAISLDTTHILPTLEADGSAKVAVKARLYNPCSEDSDCTVRIEVWSPDGASIYRKSLHLPVWKGVAPLDEFRVERPELWSPKTPLLYRCRVALSSKSGEMVQEERFGIRKVEFVERGCFKLNGERVLLRGTQRHADHAGVAAAMSDAQVREEMQMIRNVGANFVRLAHYQQDRLVLELCDELGLMVWEELPWCRAGVGGEAFRQNARDQLTNMIEQHYNHPSVIFWGLGNEDDWPEEYPSVDKQAIRGFMQEMNELAHRLDNSRLTAIRRCDFASDIPDVYSPSIWAGWYRGNYREYEQALVKGRESVKRFIHMEWGADNHAGRHAEDPEAGLHHVPSGGGTDERGLDYLKTGGDVRVSSDGDWSETYACDLCDWYLKTQEKLDWLSGSAQWIFKDFASPLRGDNGIPRINQKGMVERDLTRKELYFLFQSYWAERPMVHIYGHNWPVRWGKPGQKRLVRVYSNCTNAELFLNGVSQGTKVRDSQDFPSAGLRWEVAFAPGKNHLRVIASRGDVSLTDEVSLTYQTETWGKPAELRLHEDQRDGKRITVQAKLFDANGVLCLDAQNLVRFSLAGDGRLIDNLGTTRASREVQLANGRAEISLNAAGPCRIKAAAEGISPATCKLNAGIIG
jgi:beta-galactosidase